MIVQQRAPRLRPDQHLADSITRVGRFARVDPRKGRGLPSLLQVVGVLAWAGLLAESFRRAWAAARPDGVADPDAAAQPDAVAAPAAAAQPDAAEDRHRA